MLVRPGLCVGGCASPPVSISLPSSPLVSPFSTSSSPTSRPAPLLCLLLSSSVDCSKHRTSNYSAPSPIPRVSSSLHTLPIAVFGRRTSSPPSTKKIKSELVAIEHGEKETTNIIFIQTHNYSYNNKKYCHHCCYCRTNTVIPEHFPPCRTKRSSIRLESQQQSPSPSQTFPLHRLCRLNICTPNTRSFRSNTNLHLP